MKKLASTFFCAVVIALGTSSIAQADTINYDLTGGGGLAPTYDFSNGTGGSPGFDVPTITASPTVGSGSFDVTIGPFTVSASASPTNVNLLQTGSGLGIDNTATGTATVPIVGTIPFSVDDTTPALVDSLGLPESIQFEITDLGGFQDDAVLTSIQFDDFLPGALVNLSMGGSPIGPGTFFIPLDGLLDLSAFDVAFDGVLDISPDNALSGFSVAGLTIDATPVPEPASLAIWGLGGFGLVAYRRRKARRA